MMFYFIHAKVRIAFYGLFMTTCPPYFDNFYYPGNPRPIRLFPSSPPKFFISPAINNRLFSLIGQSKNSILNRYKRKPSLSVLSDHRTAQTSNPNYKQFINIFSFLFKTINHNKHAHSQQRLLSCL